MCRYRLVLCLLVAFILSACSRTVNDLSGVLVYGHEVRTVRLCGDLRRYWLHVTPQQQFQLQSELLKLTDQPYQKLYFEFSGSKLDEPPGELAKEYDGAIRVEKIKKITTEVPNNCIRG